MMSNRLVVSVGSLIKALYIKEKGCLMDHSIDRVSFIGVLSDS